MNIKATIKKYLTKTTIIGFAKYCSVGLVIFCIHALLLWLFKRKMLMQNYLSVPASYIIAAICHFLLNNIFIFAKSDVNYKRRISGYIFVTSCCFIINFLIANTVLYFIIDNVLAASLASAASTCVFGFTVLNFKVYKLGK